jgi:hypothetical protein
MIVNMRTLILQIVVCGYLAVTASAEMREWLNAEGTRKIKGEFVKLDGEKLTLKKPDGVEIEFPLSFLATADQDVAKKAAEKMETELGDLIGGHGDQAFDTVSFGRSPEETRAAMAKSAKVDKSGDSEFFGQVIQGSDSMAVIDGESCRLQPIFKGDRLDEMHIYGKPHTGAEQSEVKKAWSDVKTRIITAFGAPSSEFSFPNLEAMADKQNGVTHSWSLSGGRRLDLAIQKSGKEYNVTMRVVAGI